MYRTSQSKKKPSFRFGSTSLLQDSSLETQSSIAGMSFGLDRIHSLSESLIEAISSVFVDLHRCKLDDDETGLYVGTKAQTETVEHISGTRSL